MKTGRVEYAPDYKSKSAADVAARIDQIITTDLKRQAERSRLERKVLEAVKVAWIDGLISSTTLNDAVKALVEFEAKEKEV